MAFPTHPDGISHPFETSLSSDSLGVNPRMTSCMDPKREREREREREEREERERERERDFITKQCPDCTCFLVAWHRLDGGKPDRCRQR